MKIEYTASSTGKQQNSPIKSDIYDSAVCLAHVRCVLLNNETDKCWAMPKHTVQKQKWKMGVVVHTYNLSTQEAKAG
jgi:hypothetical protein